MLVITVFIIQGRGKRAKKIVTVEEYAKIHNTPVRLVRYFIQIKMFKTVHKDGWRIYLDENEKPPKLKKKSASKSETLCWKCKNAYGNCSWSKRFKPVDGWAAVPTKVNAGYKGQMDSFLVTKCPEFIKG